MNLPELGVKRPVLTSMLFLALIILGLVSLGRLGMDLLPDIEIPSVAVVTTYQGAGPQEVETQITRPIEKVMATVSGLDKIESSSSQDISLVQLRFEWGVNLEDKANEIRDKIGQVMPMLPDAAERPFVIKFDFSMMPVVMVGVEAGSSYSWIYEYLDKNVSRQLEQLPGVASVSIYGGNRREIQVAVDRRRLEAYQVSLRQVSAAIRSANLNEPGGFLKSGAYDFILRTPEELTIPQLNRVVVTQRAGRPVYLSDLATVSDGYAEKVGGVTVSDRPGLFMIVQKQSGVNTVEVANRVKLEMARIQKELPPDVHFRTLFDQADFIRRSINNLRDSLLQGGLLVILVIFFFVRDLRSSFIVAISIPVSLITTFFMMYGAGFSLNMISLSSLGIAVGMVVDAAIVVFENILRHREAGEGPIESALNGAQEVFGAVVASVLAVVTVFVPIIFTGGVSGILFKQLALSFSFCLLCSLLTAVMLIPLLSSRLLRTGGSGRGIQAAVLESGERFFRNLSAGYRNLLDWTLNHKKISLGFSCLMLLGSLLLVPLVGTEFMPEMDQGMISFSVEMPVGTRQEVTGEMIRKLTDILARNVPEAEVIMGHWGRMSGNSAMVAMSGGKPPAGYRGELIIKLISKEKRQRSGRQIAESLKPLLKAPPARVLFDASDPMASMLFGSAKPLTVEIKGYDLEKSRQLAAEVSRVLGGIPGVSDVSLSRDEGQPEYQIKVRRDKSSLMGLSVSDISSQVKSYYAGDTGNQYRESGEQYDIMIRLRDSDRADPEVLAGVYLANPGGGLVRLSQVADIRAGTGPVSISRRDQERYVEVSGEIYNRSLSSVVNEAEPQLRRLSLPSGFSLAFTGGREEQVKSFRVMLFALILSVVLVYMVMASQFESFLDPFVIMFAVPFSLIGVIWSLFLTGNTLSLTSFLGLIMLVGVVEETGIILVTFAIELRKKGLPLREALLQAGQLRLRPILMTSLTTIMGMVPLVIARGEGSEMFRPLAIVIIGGLLVAMLMTLFFIPVLYFLLEERVKKPSGAPPRPR
ncbi:MAG TPA: efflux RND transporter permease subunit [bacterium]|nr:efflux RND transporter permease subunit [bacterium]HNS48909.1 efflux RND transporter permease subunit [bacterium]